MNFGIAKSTNKCIGCLTLQKHIVFVHCHCKSYPEFHVDSTIELTFPKPVYRSHRCVSFLHMESTETRLRYTRVFARFDQNLVFHDN